MSTGCADKPVHKGLEYPTLFPFGQFMWTYGRDVKGLRGPWGPPTFHSSVCREEADEIVESAKKWAATNDGPYPQPTLGACYTGVGIEEYITKCLPLDKGILAKYDCWRAWNDRRRARCVLKVVRNAEKPVTIDLRRF